MPFSRFPRPLSSWLLILTLLPSLWSLAACSPPSGDQERRDKALSLYAGFMRKEFPEVRDLDGAELAGLLRNGTVTVVDVRSPQERAVSVVPGAVTPEEYLARRETLPSGPVVAYCTIGYRSAQFVLLLARQGVEARNLRAGILGWLHGGGTLADPAGRPTRRVHVYGSSWNLAPGAFEAVY